MILLVLSPRSSKNPPLRLPIGSQVLSLLKGRNSWILFGLLVNSSLLEILGAALQERGEQIHNVCLDIQRGLPQSFWCACVDWQKEVKLSSAL